MNKKKIFLSFCLASLFSFLFWGSNPVQKITKTETVYQETQRYPESITLTYNLPQVVPTGKTIQSQTKGGVTISTEVVPFVTSKKDKIEEKVGYKNPRQPGFDVFETIKTPYIEVSPENIEFKIRIRNREEVPLKLSEIGFAVIVDGVQWSFPSGYLEEWNRGLVLTGFEKEFSVKGPQVRSLQNAQVVYIFLNGVPTSYDKAGNVTAKNNFEWYFECSLKREKEEAMKSYSYRTAPIHKERCQSCSGVGHFVKKAQCDNCEGKGKYIYNGKVVECWKCKGSGQMVIKETCSPCKGEGQFSFPKSGNPPIKSSESWWGWYVTVQSTPVGAQVLIPNTKTGDYYTAGKTNNRFTWYSNRDKTYPIILTYNNQSVEVLPYSAEGKEIARVSVDFTGGTPIIERGVAPK